METAEMITLVGAIILGYAVLLFTMWLFRRNKGVEEKSKKN